MINILLKIFTRSFKKGFAGHFNRTRSRASPQKDGQGQH